MPLTGPQMAKKPEEEPGLIKVMYLDATVAMVVYTAVTAAFYLLGRHSARQGNMFRKAMN